MGACAHARARTRTRARMRGRARARTLATAVRACVRGRARARISSSARRVPGAPPAALGTRGGQASVSGSPALPCPGPAPCPHAPRCLTQRRRQSLATHPADSGSGCGLWAGEGARALGAREGGSGRGTLEARLRLVCPRRQLDASTPRRRDVTTAIAAPRYTRARVPIWACRRGNRARRGCGGKESKAEGGRAKGGGGEGKGKGKGRLPAGAGAGVRGVYRTQGSRAVTRVAP